jgi:aldehyde:ferredoxin oxidoreductase
MLEAVTGWTCDNEFQTKATKRIMNMRHAFNLREGQKPSDFPAPKRSVGDPPQEEGPLAGCKVDHEALKRNFFAVMEWDETTGNPSRPSLEALGGLDDVVRDLYG